MKVIRIASFLLTIIFALVLTKNALASWWAGAERLVFANGITAQISTPDTPLDLIDIASSGVSNWVSTYASDANGVDWIQAGWRFYWWYSVPKQFVEWCIDCTGSNPIYEMKDQFAIQNWGTVVDYWVDRDVNARWCASTEGVVRFCVENLHSTPVEVLAQSEIHDSSMNPLDTTFNQVRYKDPIDGVFKFFDNQTRWIELFPYGVEKFSNSHFRTYRMVTNNLYLPLVVR